jgi:hypothetical protein
MKNLSDLEQKIFGLWNVCDDVSEIVNSDLSEDEIKEALTVLVKFYNLKFEVFHDQVEKLLSLEAQKN